jgi:hypothetical protein
MMKLYLVTRTDEVDYGEAEAFVVRAPNKISALKIAHAESDQYHSPKRYLFRSDNTSIIELKNEGPEEIILGSYIGD